MDHTNVAKGLVVVGGVILAIGLVWYFWGDKLSWIGHLPGDIRIEKENVRIYIPISTMILASLLISILLRVFRHLMH
ncbi:MAG TPA: DUF2905 domain-containing protein [Saprospiraceae bacterium]|nr:DUF2905 domain-containing protein [Saprospiraceae bacterium]HPG09012.1 DUF2905 domain-containing protein [Saprospiraceae bacterium]HPQ98896.1 DUF2905 domain-containing protein [Saprospiraceae bacterium]HRV86580.1 DUF2905 domain-containing protein [Saprospiraceae bacterium]